MTIGALTVQPRNPPSNDSPRPWASIGTSMAGTVVVQNSGHSEQTITLHWSAMTMSNKNTLKNYLEGTIKVGNSVNVTPDSGDDLEVGASGATSFIYMGFVANYLKNGFYTVDVTLRKIT